MLLNGTENPGATLTVIQLQTLGKEHLRVISLRQGDEGQRSHQPKDEVMFHHLLGLRVLKVDHISGWRLTEDLDAVDDWKLWRRHLSFSSNGS